MAYSSDWNATDQIPRRAVQSGLIDSLGFIDPGFGGQTDRYAVTAAAEFDNWSATLYVIDYDVQLLSNFTYRLEDPENGDQFEQTDRRRIYGATLKGHRHVRDENVATLSWAADFCHDDIGRSLCRPRLHAPETATRVARCTHRLSSLGRRCARAGEQRLRR